MQKCDCSHQQERHHQHQISTFEHLVELLSPNLELIGNSEYINFRIWLMIRKKLNASVQIFCVKLTDRSRVIFEYKSISSKRLSISTFTFVADERAIFARSQWLLNLCIALLFLRRSMSFSNFFAKYSTKASSKSCPPKNFYPKTCIISILHVQTLTQMTVASDSSNF